MKIGYSSLAIASLLISAQADTISPTFFGAGLMQQLFEAGSQQHADSENTGNVQIPEFIGAVYLQNSTGALTPLEKTEAKAKFNPLRTRFSYQIAGTRSAVRVMRGQTILFVVRLANGIDPGSMTLHRLTPTKDGRRVEMDPDQKNSAFLTFPVNVIKVGENTYGLSPAGKLKPGEYAFSPQGVNTGYCFGVDLEGNIP